MKNLTTTQQLQLDSILESEDFKNIYDIEKEKEELAEDGWTLEEARKFAQFLIKTK